MRYYPVNLDVNGKNCLVVGGGNVGTRKAETLLACGANVTVLSKQFTPALETRGAEGLVALVKRNYTAKELDGQFLVIGATDNSDLNHAIQQDAHVKEILCNIADCPEGSSFILPAVITQGDLTLTISTSGKSPALAKKIRNELGELYGPEYGDLLVLMGAVRKKLLSSGHDPEGHKVKFEKLIAGGLLKMLSQKAVPEINGLLESVLGKGVSYEELVDSME